jgi:hypothetical protein
MATASELRRGLFAPVSEKWLKRNLYRRFPFIALAFVLRFFPAIVKRAVSSVLTSHLPQLIHLRLWPAVSSVSFYGIISAAFGSTTSFAA